MLVTLLNKSINSTDVYVALCEAEDQETRSELANTIAHWPESSFADPESPTLSYEYEFGTTMIELGLFDTVLVLLERFTADETLIQSDAAWFRSTLTPNGRAFSCDPRAQALFERAKLPPRPEHLKCE